MGKQKVIKAIKNGIEGEFSEMSWRISNPEKEGWVKLGESDAIDTIEAEEVVTVKKKIEVVDIDDDDMALSKKAKEDGNNEDADEVEVKKDYPTDDEIKEILKEKGVEFHHALGTKKLRILYDENTK